MNKVTLYQTTKSEHLTCRDQIELCQFRYNDVIAIRDSKGEFIIEQEAKILQYPVQKYIFSQKDWKGNVEERIVYASFDNELLELIQCERSKFDNLNNELVCKSAELSDLKSKNLYLEDRIVQLNKVVDKVNQMGFWKRLVFLFGGKI